MAMAHEFAAAGQWNRSRQANLLDGGAPFYGTYQCADGRHIAIGAMEGQFYDVFRQAIGLDEETARLRVDPANWPTLRERTAALIRTRPSAEWLALLENTDACVSPVLDLEEAQHHPHLVERKGFVRLDGLDQPAPAPRFSGTPTQAHARPTKLRSLTNALAAWSG